MVSERVKVHVGLAAALVVFFLSVVLLVAGTIDRGDLHAALPGSVAPDFSLRDAENQPVALSELRGNVVIVYFRGRNASPSDAPTTEPSQLTTAADSSSSPSQASPFSVSANATSASASSDRSSAAFAELSAMAQKAHDSRLKVLELATPSSLNSTDFNSPVAQVPGQDLPPSQSSIDSPVRTLFDLSGDVARKYKIDSGEPQPTFFVIDPSGIIRYRANSLQGEGALLADHLLAPATQPSSCAQVVQTLLSSEAVGLSSPTSGHF